MASLATRIFWKLPRICILVSASTIRVLVLFSIENLVLPLLPARRPMQRARCSPRSVLTSLISKPSMYRSSMRSSAIASRTSKPEGQGAAAGGGSAGALCVGRNHMLKLTKDVGMHKVRRLLQEVGVGGLRRGLDFHLQTIGTQSEVRLQYWH